MSNFTFSNIKYKRKFNALPPPKGLHPHPVEHVLLGDDSYLLLFQLPSPLPKPEFPHFLLMTQAQ